MDDLQSGPEHAEVETATGVLEPQQQDVSSALCIITKAATSSRLEQGEEHLNPPSSPIRLELSIDSEQAITSGDDAGAISFTQPALLNGTGDDVNMSDSEHGQLSSSADLLQHNVNELVTTRDDGEENEQRLQVLDSKKTNTFLAQNDVGTSTVLDLNHHEHSQLSNIINNDDCSAQESNSCNSKQNEMDINKVTQCQKELSLEAPAEAEDSLECMVESMLGTIVTPNDESFSRTSTEGNCSSHDENKQDCDFSNGSSQQNDQGIPVALAGDPCVQGLTDEVATSSSQPDVSAGEEMEMVNTLAYDDTTSISSPESPSHDSDKPLSTVAEECSEQKLNLDNIKVRASDQSLLASTDTNFSKTGDNKPDCDVFSNDKVCGDDKITTAIFVNTSEGVGDATASGISTNVEVTNTSSATYTCKDGTASTCSSSPPLGSRPIQEDHDDLNRMGNADDSSIVNKEKPAKKSIENVLLENKVEIQTDVHVQKVSKPARGKSRPLKAEGQTTLRRWLRAKMSLSPSHLNVPNVDTIAFSRSPVAKKTLSNDRGNLPGKLHNDANKTSLSVHEFVTEDKSSVVEISEHSRDGKKVEQSHLQLESTKKEKSLPKARKSFQSGLRQSKSEDHATNTKNSVSITNMTFKVPEIENALGIERKSLEKMDSKTIDDIMLKKLQSRRSQSPMSDNSSMSANISAVLTGQKLLYRRKRKRKMGTYKLPGHKKASKKKKVPTATLR